MNKFTNLPGETADQWRARYDQITEETQQIRELIDKIYDLARQTNREASANGFFQGWLAIMFERMDADERKMALARFSEYDQELLMIKMAGEPA